MKTHAVSSKPALVLSPANNDHDAYVFVCLVIMVIMTVIMAIITVIMTEMRIILVMVRVVLLRPNIRHN